MALTITEGRSSMEPGGGKKTLFSVTFDASYASSGGETFDISSYFGTLYKVSPDDNTASGYVIQHDGGSSSAGKLAVFEAGADGAALDEVAATTDLSALTCTVEVWGIPA